MEGKRQSSVGVFYFWTFAIFIALNYVGWHSKEILSLVGL